MHADTFHHERLSALDAFLLCAEDATSPMHVAAVLLFEAGPLRTAEGRLDMERLHRLVRSRLARIPRYRQRLEYVPVLHHPVWVDDPDFDVRSHVREVSLAPPGALEQLKTLVGSLAAPPLDRRRPLWELYVVDGLEGDRLALVAKVHHCIVDGVLGVAVITSVLDGEPVEQVEEAASWEPRPAPPPGLLLQEELRYRGQRTADILRRGLEWIERDDETGHGKVRETVRGLLTHLKSFVPSSHTPINPERIGPRRAFDWVRLDMDRVNALRRCAECTVNDVVIATVAGAVRRLLRDDGVDVEGLDFRVMVPVSEHEGPADTSGGNRVSLMIVRLPVDEADPRERLRRSVQAMGEAKASKQADALAAAEELADWSTATLLGEGARRLMHLRPFNMVVTNVPGPPVPLYLLGARLLECYPLVPLFVNTGVGIALLSYAGSLGIGINADPDVIDDTRRVASAVEKAFDELERSVPLTDAAPSGDDERWPERPRRPRG